MAIREKRKFLKQIYEIQRQFGVDFVGVSRTFSFGIKPDKEQSDRLQEWFRQIGSAKEELYQDIFEHFKNEPGRYLGKKIDYATFFKGNTVFEKAKKKYPLLTAVPAQEGLRMEMPIPSFVTNHKRHFDEIIEAAKNISDQLEKNTEEISAQKIEFEYDTEKLTKELDLFLGISYEEICKVYGLLSGFSGKIELINFLIGDYNYELNQLLISNKSVVLKFLNKLGRMDSFPGINERTEEDTKGILQSLESLAAKKPEMLTVTHYIRSTAKKTARHVPHQRLTFERRMAHWLSSQPMNDQEKADKFISGLEAKLAALKHHSSFKQYDSASRNIYFQLLSLKARLANPGKILEVNELKSRLSGSFLKVRAQSEIITLPGFSWGEKKPLKNVALAFESDGRLAVCVSASAKSFIIGNKLIGKTLRFVKTTGGSRKKAAWKPKVIEFVEGSFSLTEEGLPLLLPLHFGKSQARRYVTNRQWGLFSENPKVFMRNARLKRTKSSPGDQWKYFLDVTLSSDKNVFGFKEFRKQMLKQADAVIGIDRGEVNPIAFAVVDKKGQVIEKGILGHKEYIENLKKYELKKRLQQSRGGLPSKSLRSKISRLQKTTLETSISQILSLVAKYKAAVVIEDLGRKFSGSERSIIPKKTYKHVEDLLANALNFCGLLRLGTKGPIKYWGAMLPVLAAGTSSICPQCHTWWRSAAPMENKSGEKFYAYNDLLEYSTRQNFSNIDFEKRSLKYNNDTIILNPEWKTYSKSKPQGETKTLDDLKIALKSGGISSTERLLRSALGHRPLRDTFVCHSCGFSGNSDEVAAINIARRGNQYITRILTKQDS